ncbi:hypothetical protein [Terrihabitans rhizophilus]|uniref:hypothetical protein n=1 Tax=Terrihabitans rhizophilus TaxID=3092662 RepID=UPI003CC6CC43
MIEGAERLEWSHGRGRPGKHDLVSRVGRGNDVRNTVDVGGIGQRMGEPGPTVRYAGSREIRAIGQPGN